MRRICNWSPLPREWCHYDRDSQLRADRRQDLRCWPVPDGECQLLPPRCLQDYITKVKHRGEGGFYFTNITRSWGCNVWIPHTTPSLLQSCTQKKYLSYHPAFAAAYMTINRHLTPLTFSFIPSSSRLCRWHFDIQKFGAHIHSWQARIDIGAAELFTPAACCWCCLSHNQSHKHPLHSPSRTLGLLCSHTCTAQKWLCLR